MTPPALGHGIRYSILERADVPGMTHLLGEVFAQHEPPARAVGMSSADVEGVVAIFAVKALAEGLTVIARDSAGRVVGAMLSEDFGTPEPPGIERVPARFAPVGVLLDTLEAQYRASHPVVPGSHVHLFMLAVADGFGGRGVAQSLVTLCLEHATHRSYRRAVTEATGQVSQHIFRKLGFIDSCSASYRDFLYGGDPVFASIAAHGGTLLMERALTPA